MAHLDRFAAAMATLEEISRKELIHAPLSTNETAFLDGIMENRFSYGGIRTYSGWYPGLYYKNFRFQDSQLDDPSDKWDALITDVHTDPPAALVGDPGGVLHQAVGNVHLLMLAVDCGPGDMAVYAGPVLSHYEFETAPDVRQTDSGWKAQLRGGILPSQPEWTRSYLVPGPYVVPGNVR
jgi:hypothetical protein